MEKVYLYDTTLRDGVQAEDVLFSVEDKIRIVHLLDEMEIDYIEGGYPASNPKDKIFFKEISKAKLKNAIIFAFGSTYKPGSSVDKDSGIKALLRASVPGVTIVGKSWDVHVTDAMEIELGRNIELIHDTLTYLKPRFDFTFFDAEHYFDGFKSDRNYALKTLKAAVDAGADCLVLCDTNGGTLPMDLVRILEETKAEIKTPLGIHTHNDSDLAVANTLMAVSMGLRHVQGTVNGIGERCGNADLCSIIPNLILKMNYDCIPRDRLKRLRDLSVFVYEISNMKPNMHQPFVGSSAFAHKGGIHVSAVTKHPQTYEHINPEEVGNRQRILVSEQAGMSNILYKAKEFGLNMGKGKRIPKDILARIKELELEGFQFDVAEASFELLMNEMMGKYKSFFELMGFRVIVEKRSHEEEPFSEATIKVRFGEKIEHTAAEGNGPVDALDKAARKALEKLIPELKKIELVDYKVRLISTEGTGSRVRVLIESGDKGNQENRWSTVGVSENIIEASWKALVDSINYKLLKSRG